MDMMSMTAVELGKKIKAGEISVMEATKACIENIKTYDKEYNCFITVDEEGAFKIFHLWQKNGRMNSYYEASLSTLCNFELISTKPR